MYPNLLSVKYGSIFLSKFKYRDRATITMDILGSINRDPKGRTKTSIMRAANLNLDQANKYLDFLTLCDLVKAVDPLKRQEKDRYKLTSKGVNLLKNFQLWPLILETYQRRII